MFTDGQTDDGRQAHAYIPQTFRSGDKKGWLHVYYRILDTLTQTHGCTLQKAITH